MNLFENLLEVIDIFLKKGMYNRGKEFEEIYGGILLFIVEFLCLKF